jgi:hypothetical protein
MSIIIVLEKSELTNANGTPRWQSESQVTFNKLVLHARGYRLHDIRVGARPLMQYSKSPPIHIKDPLTFDIVGQPAELISAELDGTPDVDGPPFVIVKVPPFKPFNQSFAKQHKRPRPRVIVVR